MGKYGQAIRAKIKAFYKWIIAVLRIKRVLEWAKEITRKKNFFESVRTVVSCIVVFTVFFAYLQWRATTKDQSANRFLNIIDKLGNLHSESVRAGAVITMGAHLTENEENYEEYHGQSIPVLVIHLAKESSPTVRKEIVKVLSSRLIKTDHVFGPLSSEIRELTLEIEKRSSPSLIEPYIRGEANENLVDMSELLVTVLGKMPPKKLDLSGFYLVDWSSEDTNWEDANFEKFRLVRGSLKRANLKYANLRGAELYLSDLTRASLQDANLGGAYLREVILKNAQLNEANLANTNLRSSDLGKAILTNATLSEAILVDANMEGATLEGADLFAANLEGATLDSAHLKFANLTNANLADATLIDAEVEWASLEGADLFAANLQGATLASSRLKGANLTDANLTDSDLKGAILASAYLKGANLTTAILTNTILTDANLTNAILKNATLKKALLEGAILDRAILDGADLEGANLTNASMSDVVLRHANMEAAILKGADLAGADLEGANLKDADLRAALLFGIDPNKFQSDLDKGTISKDLQKEFENKGISLSENTTVSIREKDRRRLITDKDNKQTYTVRKEEDQLNICKETKIDLADVKKAKNWDKAIFDDDVKQKLFGPQD